MTQEIRALIDQIQSQEALIRKLEKQIEIDKKLIETQQEAMDYQEQLISTYEKLVALAGLGIDTGSTPDTDNGKEM